MAGTRKTPQLRFDGRYYVVNVYKPDGKRTTISFGPAQGRTEGQVYSAFGQWLDLFQRNPHKTLSFRSPYEAIQQSVSPLHILTIGQFIDKYLAWARQTMVPTGQSRVHTNITRAERLHRFLEPYRDWPIDDFGPDELAALREAMVAYKYQRGRKEARYTRSSVNDTMRNVHTVWRWGVGRGIVTLAQAERLKEVRPLRIGQTEAPDVPKRARVTQEEFEKVLPLVPTVVADMLRLIWYTAMRPGEVCGMRPFDILHDDPECWIYIPGRGSSPVGQHKTAHLGRIKVIALTKNAQRILVPRITDFASREYIFAPDEAIRELYERRRASQQKECFSKGQTGEDSEHHPMITPGKKYTTGALRNACKRGCLRAGVDAFVPYDLRRTAATGARALLGKEAARVLLGHTSTDTTDIYLLEEVQEAMRIAKVLDHL